MMVPWQIQIVAVVAHINRHKATWSQISVRTRMSLCHLFFWLVTSLAFPETEVLSKGKKD